MSIFGDKLWSVLTDGTTVGILLGLFFIAIGAANPDAGLAADLLIGSVVATLLFCAYQVHLMELHAKKMNGEDDR
jgi:hypothetical protein